MAIKGYSAFPNAPALLEHHHQIVSCHILDTRWGSLTPLQICSRCILQPGQQGQIVNLHKCNMEYIYIYGHNTEYMYICTQHWIYIYIYIYTILNIDLLLSRVTWKLPFLLLLHQGVGEGATPFLGLLHLPLIDTKCWVLSKKAISPIFWVLGMTRPGIELSSPRPLANTPNDYAHIIEYI